MKLSGRVQPDNLEHSELQFSVFIAVTVMVLAVGMAVLMYPVVFSHQTPGDRTMHTAFWGFCVLCVCSPFTSGIAMPRSESYGVKWLKAGGRSPRLAGRPVSNC